METRVFVAIELPEICRDFVAVYISALKNEFPEVPVRWVKPDNLHLTVKFLGNTGPGRLDQLIDSVEKTARCFTDFRLILNETGVFPDERRGKVLWLGLEDPSGNLADLHQHFESECRSQGFERDSRFFKPHLSIARLRQPISRELIRRHLVSRFGSHSFRAFGLSIFESQLRQSGSVYSVIRKSKFN